MKGLMRAILPWLAAGSTTFVTFVLTILILRIVLPDYVPDNLWTRFLISALFVGTVAFGMLAGISAFYRIENLLFKHYRWFS